MKISKMVFYYNTPLRTFNDTIHFSSNSERDKFFDTHYRKATIHANIVKDRLTVRAPIPYFDSEGINYCHIESAFTNQRYYFFILANGSYRNDEVTTFELVPDALMTYTQGDFLNQLNNVRIHRQHCRKATYKARLQELQTNSDILATTTNAYCHTEFFPFDDLMVLFQCCVSLERPFGTEKKPSLKLPDGIVYDNLPSPVGLFACELTNWHAFTEKLVDYPWIGQNISNIILVPKIMIDTVDLRKTALNGEPTDLFMKFTNGGVSSNKDLKIWSVDELMRFCGLDPQKDQHLFRKGYITIEMTAYDGQLVGLDPAFCPSTGLKLRLENSVGYSNSIRIYPDGWASNGDARSGNVRAGAYLNNALVFDNWASIPLLIDNYKLSLANSANQIAYAESRTLSGRIHSMDKEIQHLGTGGLNNAQDLFVDAYSVLGGGLHPATVASKIVDDVEFYRQQKAQFADLALSPPTITSQKEGQAFLVANGIYGVTLKFSAPTSEELDKVRRYYATMGFQFEDYGRIEPIDTMSICNYLQVTGNLNLNIPSGYLQLLTSLLANGVRFWHNNGTDNPMLQDVSQNTMKK